MTLEELSSMTPEEAVKRIQENAKPKDAPAPITDDEPLDVQIEKFKDFTQSEESLQIAKKLAESGEI